eukprot:c834_g1_i1.p1 GENE.c834_g1_i1~~c834_g1_i1.p1  ORF type:complete len:126 (-),score=32.53 c834_g1_i1:83-412(-)
MASENVMGCPVIASAIKDRALKTDIITWAKALIDKSKEPIDDSKVAAALRKEVEKKYKITWNVIVGKGGLISAVAHEQEKFIYFQYKSHDILVFKTYEQFVKPPASKKK